MDKLIHAQIIKTHEGLLFEFDRILGLNGAPHSNLSAQQIEHLTFKNKRLDDYLSAYAEFEKESDIAVKAQLAEAIKNKSKKGILLGEVLGSSGYLGVSAALDSAINVDETEALARLEKELPFVKNDTKSLAGKTSKLINEKNKIIEGLKESGDIGGFLPAPSIEDIATQDEIASLDKLYDQYSVGLISQTAYISNKNILTETFTNRLDAYRKHGINKITPVTKEALANLQALDDQITKEAETQRVELLSKLVERSSITDSEAAQFVESCTFSDAAIKMFRKSKYPIKQVKLDLAEFYKITNGKIAPVNFETNNIKRASASIAEGVINVDEDFTKTTLFHEGAHLLENNGVYKAAANGLISARLKKQMELTGKSEDDLYYDLYKGEKVLDDGFYHPYSGKKYDDKYTEIWPMAAQALASTKDFESVLSNDPEHLEYFLALCNIPINKAAQNEKVSKTEKMEKEMDAFLNDLGVDLKNISPIRLTKYGGVTMAKLRKGQRIVQLDDYTVYVRLYRSRTFSQYGISFSELRVNEGIAYKTLSEVKAHLIKILKLIRSGVTPYTDNGDSAVSQFSGSLLHEFSEFKSISDYVSGQ